MHSTNVGWFKWLLMKIVAVRNENEMFAGNIFIQIWKDDVIAKNHGR
jgi:hypothetical protein